MSYRLPDPLTNPVDAFVLSYKTIKNVEYDDRGWDQIHWARTKKSAKLILEVLKDLKSADRFMLDFSAKMETMGYNWTIETLAKHAHEWALNNQGRKEANGLSARSRFFADLTKSRAENKSEADGGEASREALHAMFRSHASPASDRPTAMDASHTGRDGDATGPMVEVPSNERP